MGCGPIDSPQIKVAQGKEKRGNHLPRFSLLCIAFIVKMARCAGKEELNER